MIVRDGKKLRWEEHAAHNGKPFLQPVAMAIVCIVIVLLIFGMGMLDLRRLDGTLSEFMEERGVAIVGVVQRLTQENLNSLVQSSRRSDGASPAVQPSSPQRLLVNALAEIGKDVDIQWKDDRLRQDHIRKMADERGIYLIAIFDKKGRAVFQSRPLPPDMADGAADGAVTAERLNRLGEANKLGFVALQRRDGSGSIIVALDPDGLRYWGIRVSIEKAIAELGGMEGQGLSYFVVMDPQEKTLGSAGRLPERWQAGDMPTAAILAGSPASASRKVIYLDKQVLDIAAPLVLNGKITGIVRLGLDRGGAEKILAENRNNIISFMVLTMLIAFVSLWLLYRDQNAHLAGIVRIERQLEKAERLSALGQLAAGVAHEIRNPLNAISMASQRLKRDFAPSDPARAEEFQTMTGVIRDEIRRLNGIIEEFLTFSRSRRLDLRDFSVVEILQKIVLLLQEEAASRHVALKTAWNAEGSVIPMDLDKLQQALLNFIKNAMESLPPEGGTVTLSVKDNGPAGIVIRIADTGCGMDAEEMERIFSPEYTTKEKGLGLGLPLSHEIIRGHGGEISVTSAKGEGTTFEIRLPRVRETKAAKDADKKLQGEQTA